MSVGTDVKMDVFTMLALDTELGEEKPCESAGHFNPFMPTHVLHDDGPGVWYMQFVCQTGCGYSTGVVLVCDSWKEVSFNEPEVGCRECGEYQNPKKCFVVVERK